MGWFVGLRAKLYAVAAALGSALLVGLYWLGRRDERKRRERDELRQRIKVIKESKEIQGDVEGLDDDELRDRASRHVRKDK